MSMYEWAENECRIACKKENPEYNFDSDAFDYGCSCYKSALKAYKSLCEDGHSGFSFNETKKILSRLLESQPLTPITEEDFVEVSFDDKTFQCARMPSLFKSVKENGEVYYSDIDRAYFVNIEDPSDTYNSGTAFLDEMFPITLPYYPSQGKYRIYEQTFLTDKSHGDLDTKGTLYMITPDNKRIDLNIYMTEGDDGKWKYITKEEYDELLSKRIDKLSSKAAQKLIWTLVSNSGSDNEIDVKERAYSRMDPIYKQTTEETLRSMCEFFEKPENYRHNTFSMRMAICDGDEEYYKHIPEIAEIANLLKDIKSKLLERK